MADGRDVVRTGAELIAVATDRWLTPPDLDAPLVIFVHGFTSQGRYMGDLARYVRAYGFASALFNYDSHLGIETGAEALVNRLQPLLPTVAKYGYALVGHSMGGLVIRLFAQRAELRLREEARGLCLLGTPNAGTLSGREFVSRMLDWSDWLTGANPYARSGACRAASQLTVTDSERLLEVINAYDRSSPPVLPILSISGGLNYLEFGEARQGMFSGALRNRALQSLIAEVPNDGLVAESSSDIRRVLSGPSVRHVNAYPDFDRTNHTYLARNQGIADIIVDWLSGAVFTGRD